MKSKFYSLAGLRLRVDSEREIAESRFYSAFYAPEGPCDLRIRVTEGPLPEKEGVTVDRYEGREFRQNGGLTLFSSYPRIDGERVYACRKETENGISLTVDHPGGLWDAMLFHALNIPELLAQRGVYLLHCSYVISRGEALLFCAGKGVGKSTQAALWEKYRGAEIVNGDRALLRLTGTGMTASGTPYCGSSEVSLNRTAPVKAVILLEQGPDNELAPCRGAKALTRLMAQMSYEKYQTEKAIDFAAGVCTGVPVCAMRCLPEESAVSLLEEALWK